MHQLLFTPAAAAAAAKCVCATFITSEAQKFEVHNYCFGEHLQNYIQLSCYLGRYAV